MNISLLPTQPDLISICTKILGHANPGDNHIAALNAATAGYPERWDPSYMDLPGQRKFGMYGDPIASVNPITLEWEYDSTATQSFQVYCNKSRWYFSSENSIAGFTVTVWDSTNTVQILDNYYTSDMWVRVKPNANNGGVTNKVCTISIATYNDVIMVGSTMIGTQKYQGAGNPPIVSPFCDQPLVLSGVSTILNTGDLQLYLRYTLTGMTISPHDVYFTVTRDSGVYVGSATRMTRSGQSTEVWITLTEPAISGKIYSVYLIDNNQ